ncbi:MULTISPECIES: hypothetical protein [unclassified Pseudoxanthomonas]|uniref:hypothetical protein n=1 Tax=unclassified Pseudoxanthomonas TaxID=2645906 RepID=UPI00307804FF
MPRHAARTLALLLRQSTMALLMLAALVNPILVAVSDLHDVGAGSGHSHNADEHGSDLAGPDFAEHLRSEHGLHGDEGDETDDFLHALMHASHCCGHLTAMYNGFHVPDVVPTRSGSLPAQVEQRLPQAYSDHFRPPIAT